MMTIAFLFSFLLVKSYIPINARWTQHGLTVAGGYGRGKATNQLNWPEGLFVDNDQTMLIAAHGVDRIIQWKKDDMNGQVVTGGQGEGTRLNQFNCPTDVLIDKEMDSLIICDLGNRRVMQWSHRSGTTQGEILISNIDCYGLAMDDKRNLYVSDTDKHEVRRYQIGDNKGTLVAGGHGKGARLNQLNQPKYLFADRQQAVYVSDHGNHHVMKWDKDATEKIIIAAGQSEGNALTQLNHPNELFTDTLGVLYVADTANDRVMRWPEGAKEGTAIVGGNGCGKAANQLTRPMGLSFDRNGNLYVVDYGNDRVQRFSTK
ncbi:unnamed protein product [Rotaria sp. Silwood2]|nr:unnamed protein product [Rotaria sp. Silwood2]CAF4544911.1 unnamed protein product [Rotaria sp. Silwood2]